MSDSTGPNGAGYIDIYNQSGTVNVIVDQFGIFTDATGTVGSRYVGLAPTRLLDTRPSSPLSANQNYLFQFTTYPCQGSCASEGGVPIQMTKLPAVMVEPVEDVTATFTVTGPGAAGSLTLWRDGATQPATSDLNFTAGLTISNMVVPRTGLTTGTPPYSNVYIRNASNGSTQLVIDVCGYYI